MGAPKLNFDPDHLNEMLEAFSEFGIYVQAGYTLIKATGELNRKGFDAVSLKFDVLEESSPQHYIFDFAELNQVSVYWARALMRTAERVKRSGTERSVLLINGNRQVLTSLKNQGLDKAIQVSANIETATADIGLTRPLSFDVNIVLPFIDCTVQAIDTMAETASKKLEPYVQDAKAPLLGDISAVVSLNSPTFNGTFVVSFPKDTILKIVERMAGQPPDGLSSLVQSTVGEFVNQASTRAKTVLNDLGYGLKCDIPRVTFASHTPSNADTPNTKCLIVPFETEFGMYFVDIRCR